MVKLAADGSGDTRHGISFLDLTEDLRLTHHHGIEACGDAKEMADGLLIAMLVDMSFEQGRIEAKMLLQKTGEVDGRRLGRGQNLNPVAGGKRSCIRLRRGRLPGRG